MIAGRRSRRFVESRNERAGRFGRAGKHDPVMRLAERKVEALGILPDARRRIEYWIDRDRYEERISICGGFFFDQLLRLSQDGCLHRTYARTLGEKEIHRHDATGDKPVEGNRVSVVIGQNDMWKRGTRRDPGASCRARDP